MSIRKLGATVASLATLAMGSAGADEYHGLDVETVAVKALSARPCPAPAEIDRCAVVALQVGLTAGLEQQHTHVVAGGFVDSIRQRYGAAAPVVFDAMMPAIGKALRGRDKQLKRLAEETLDLLETMGVARFFRAQPTVSLSPRAIKIMERIGREYFLRTGKRILITSGTRDAYAQARAMYDMLTYGGSILRLYGYRKPIVALNRAYRKGRKGKRKRSRDATIREMASLIEAQMDSGVYISRHLVAGAVDVRSYNMSARERRAFRAAVRSVSGVRAALERKPPHWHLSLKKAKLK